MTESQFHILAQAQEYVSGLFLTKINKITKFHTLQHTQEVVVACERMAEYYKLPDEDRFALSLAAWFHDTGYSNGQAKDHEEKSKEMVIAFLQQHQVSQTVIDKVNGLINATRMPQQPMNELEKIICDADLYHLGTDDFYEKSRLLREEFNENGKMGLSKKDWRKINIEFLEKHHYFTSFAKQELDPVKQKHLTELKEKLNGGGKKAKKQAEEKADQKTKKEEEETKKAADQKKKKEKELQSERAISTVFRIMAQNHANLSQMADTKSNILISVNAIILSFVIGTLFKDVISTDIYLQVPVALLVTVCVLSIVFSILATRPTITSGTFTREDIANKKTNLLFFGNFHQMSLSDYDWAMTEMLGDKHYLYSSMIKDNYFLGIVLAKKYRYLRIAYTIFMFGLILSMIAFTVAFLLPETTAIYTPG
jgi:predicted metal-dependent HD superfamily phosphohydrolase